MQICHMNKCLATDAAPQWRNEHEAYKDKHNACGEAPPSPKRFPSQQVNMGRKLTWSVTGWLFTILFLVTSIAHVDAKQECAADPLADPENDPCNSLRYIPSNKLAALALSKPLLLQCWHKSTANWRHKGHYLLVGIIHIFSTLKWGAVWMSALTVGCFSAPYFSVSLVNSFLTASHPTAYALGIALRFGLHNNPDSLALYIVMDLFVSLSVCDLISTQLNLMFTTITWMP